MSSAIILNKNKQKENINYQKKSQSNNQIKN